MYNFRWILYLDILMLKIPFIAAINYNIIRKFLVAWHVEKICKWP